MAWRQRDVSHIPMPNLNLWRSTLGSISEMNARCAQLPDTEVSIWSHPVCLKEIDQAVKVIVAITCNVTVAVSSVCIAIVNFLFKIMPSSRCRK